MCLKRLNYYFLILFGFLLLAGCVKDITVEQEVHAEFPENWQAENLIADVDKPQAWLEDLNSPVLDQLVEEALSGNLPLKAALARWQAAQAQSEIAGAPLKPNVEVGGDVARRRVNQTSSDDFSFDVSASWEADVWGRLANAERAAINDEQAFAADYHAAKLSLAADVAQNWFASIEAEQQETLAIKNARTFKQNLDVIEERYRRGLNSALDVHLARTDAANAENAATQRTRQKDPILRRLDVLLGRYPAAELAIAKQLPILAKKVPVGIPADILIRRPDLLAADNRLSAAGERVEEARKNRLPAIRLTGSGGLRSAELNQLLDWDSLVWNLLASVTQPIYAGGRLDAEQALAKARHGELWANYAQAVLNAFREVETALAAEDRYARQLVQLQLAVYEAGEGADLALSQYQNGLIDIITLLQAQQRAFNSESTLLRVHREQLDNRIALYLALGGEFSSSQARLLPGNEQEDNQNN
ncbi:MAG: efflux transporter outer membrane subunit [Gammaproteobacteria bacterium]